MTKRGSCAAVFLSTFLIFAATPAGAAVEASDVIGRAIDGFVRPAYAALHERALAMKGNVEALCKNPSQENLAAARTGFAALVAAWSRAEIIRFGPITEDNRSERILFWPDRRSIGLKQVQAAIANGDESAADPQRIAGKSVAMQGLGALEFILHGTGSDRLAGEDGAYRCAYGAAVATNIEGISSAVNAAWAKPDGFAALWTSPGPDNPIYRDGTEAVTELMDVFINGLEMVRDVRIKGFLGETPDDDRPRRAIFRRSGLTGVSLAGNLEAMDELFLASGVGNALPEAVDWMANSTHIQLVNGVNDARALTGPIEESLADPEQRAKLEHFRLVTSSLSRLIGTRISAEFGLTAGFSSLDGD